MDNIISIAVTWSTQSNAHLLLVLVGGAGLGASILTWLDNWLRGYPK